MENFNLAKNHENRFLDFCNAHNSKKNINENGLHGKPCHATSSALKGYQKQMAINEQKNSDTKAIAPAGILNAGFELDLLVGDDVLHPRMHDAALMTTHGQLQNPFLRIPDLLRLPDLLHELQFAHSDLQLTLGC